MTNEELWQAVLAQIQFNISKANFATWFNNTQIISNENGEVCVAAPNSFSKEWLCGKYQNAILKSLRALDQNIRTVDFVVKPQAPYLDVKKSQLVQKVPENQLQFEEFKIDPKTNLNPNYLFDNFVVGSFNELAHAAAWAVSEKPGSAYNPLFVYGGVGLGKTHLLQATGNKIAKTKNKKLVKYHSSERFVSAIVEAIRNQTIEKLKQETLRIDVLIVDDVQFFAGKDKTQEVFFHIFNALYHNQKQIILSSDRPPGAIPAIEERLKSRFAGGMIADIGSPDLETRLAILKTKCEEKNLELPLDVLNYIASNIQKNIREMEGALNRILVFQKMNSSAIDIETTKKLFSNITDQPQKTTTVKKIIQAVVNFYDLKQNDVFLITRRKEIVKPRQIAMYLLRTELNESYPAIGRRFKGKDHTTAIYACKKIAKNMAQNNNLSTEINMIKQSIYNTI